MTVELLLVTDDRHVGEVRHTQRLSKVAAQRSRGIQEVVLPAFVPKMTLRLNKLN